MERKKLHKVSKYVITSTMLANSLAAPAIVYAADEKLPQDVVQNAVRDLLSKGVISGDGSGNMNLSDGISRIQAASILARALNLKLPNTNGSSTFADVSSDSWGLKYIEALAKLGIMVGSDGVFRPNDSLTKEELAVILVRVTQIDVTGKGNSIPVNDKHEISDWAKPFVQAALELGLMQAPNGLFGAQKEVSRQEVFVTASAFIDSPVFAKYKDSINTLYDTGKKVSNSDPTV